MNSYTIIGLMSGTSMDGVDLTLASYEKSENGNWSYRLINYESFSYTNDLKSKLSILTSLPAAQLFEFDREIGRYFGELVNQFIEKYTIDKTNIDAIASHGHTVFHQPEKGYTVQIGSGIEIALKTGVKVINDFRSKDVALGGQGAPLVPIGDKLLFNDLADAFLNIGGFTNISLPNQQPILAFDISPGNLPLNEVMKKNFGLAYDPNGRFASEGKIDQQLLEKLNCLEYYNQNGPKSLGTEWLEAHFNPLLYNRNPHDLLRTLVEHIASQISIVLNKHDVKRLAITGGGALNTFLVDRIKDLSVAKIIELEQHTIEFKEAIVFGFLGALYLAGENNILKEVTGARASSKSGTLHLP